MPDNAREKSESLDPSYTDKEVSLEPKTFVDGDVSFIQEDDKDCN